MSREYILADQFVDEETEKGLIAQCIQNPNLFLEIRDTISEIVFCFSEPAAAWRSFESEESLPEEALSWIPLTSDLVESARRLVDLYQRRLAADLAQKLFKDINDQTQPASEVIAKHEAALFQVQQATKELESDKLVKAPDLFHSVLTDITNRIEARKTNPDGVVGIPCHLKTLNVKLGGFQQGIHILAAEPGKGKTSLCLEIAVYASSHQIPVVFVSFEEPLDRLTLKAVCLLYESMEAKKYLDGYGNLADITEAIRERGQALKYLYLLEGIRKLTVSQVKANALRAMAETGSDRCLIIVDYLQKWAASRLGVTEFRHTVSGLLSELRELAMRLKMPVIAVSSQNRVEQGQAKMTSLKESGELEYTADSIMFLTKSQEKRLVSPPMRAIDLILMKNRYGDTGKIELLFNPKYGHIREAAK